jgi:UDP-glucose 4-epimerase
MTEIAVIGSGGFIGRHLTERLSSEKNVKLSLYNRSGSTQPGSKPIDFSDAEKLKRDFASVSVIYYLVSGTIPASSWHNPSLELERNLAPFLSFMDAVAPLSPKRIAFVSSAGTVYGPVSARVGEDAGKKPFSPYGIVKLAMENFLNYYEAKYRIMYDVYRVTNVFGEGQDTSKGLGIINTFLEHIIKSGAVKVFGDGNNTRNYIYVRDVAHMLAFSLRNAAGSGTYNVSSPYTRSVRQLLDDIKSAIGRDFRVEYSEGRGSDNPYIDVDNCRILQELGNFSFTGLQEGIRKTYQHLLTTYNNGKTGS